ncbi:plasmid replication protein RepC [Pinisolibacter sp.]|uniref:plasmid replication protein RepC n=1 Tax=Pinisolibacter sp. TaxID=2172024 RepID=UPI002FDC9774
MQPYQSRTPFGGRSLTLAHVAAQSKAEARAPEKVVHKWEVFRSICTAKARLGVSERALAVLDALLSFHPETTLSGDKLVVWPSNRQLALRAHGMAPATLRRHIAGLVDAGLVVRRDSPNGKRYARKGEGGEIDQAFGFDLTPLVARAEEIESLAEDVRAADRALRLARERITICRRDIAKMIATGLEEGVATRREGRGPADWSEVHAHFRSIVEGIPRNAGLTELEGIAEDLSTLADDVFMLLEMHGKDENPSADESQIERHIQNSNPHPSTELEPRFQEVRAARAEIEPLALRPVEGAFPLGMVLQACPDIVDYARDGISNWRDFLATAAVVRPMLGISPSAWEEARGILGEVQAAVVVAAILQRHAMIASAGGYLRSLTRKAEEGGFSLGPMLMALIGSRKREKARA